MGSGRSSIGVNMMIALLRNLQNMSRHPERDCEDRIIKRIIYSLHTASLKSKTRENLNKDREIELSVSAGNCVE